MELRFPIFWGPQRRPSAKMQLEGDHFTITVELPRGALVRYEYSAPFLDYDHREQVRADHEANRMIVPTGDTMTIDDDAYPFGHDGANLGARLKGRVVDDATGKPLVEPWLSVDGILTSAINGTFDIAVRDRSFLVTAFTLDGSHRAKSFMTAPGDAEIRMAPAARAHVRLEAAVQPPPGHHVRVYGTAAQFGTPYWIGNLHHTDNFRTFKGGVLELDLYDGQWVDYLYSVGNTVSSYEQKDRQWVFHSLRARDGLVVRDVVGPFLTDKTTWFNVTVPSYTGPADAVGISQLDPRFLLMHPKGDHEWTLAVSNYDTEGRAYRYYKTWIGVGDEKTLSRTAKGTAITDTVDAWKHQSGPSASAQVAVPPIKNPFKVWAYLPDWYSTQHALNIERVIDRAAADGLTGVVLNQVQQYSDVEKPYVSQTSTQWSLYMPAYEAFRATKYAHEKGLEVMIATQMGGAEAFLHTGRLFPADWWASFFQENERLNIHNARLAEAAGADYLWFHAKEPGFVMDDSLHDDFNRAMRQTITLMREVYKGKIVVLYDEFHEGQDYWKLGDVVNQGGWSGNLSSGATQAEVDAWAANLLDARYKPHQEAAGKPMFMHVAIQSVQGALGGRAIPEHEGPQTEVNHAEPLSMEEQLRMYEAFFKAANDRPWLSGLYVWVYGFTDAPETRDYDVAGKSAQALARAWANAIP